jgi:type I restriction enzyme M protein
MVDFATRRKQGGLSCDHMSKERRTEARTRYYCRDEAKRLGWNTAHPKQGGAFLEENEFVQYLPSFSKVLGHERPDFVVLVSQKPVMVIEAKAELARMETAVNEAMYYADKMRSIADIRIAVGICGSAESGVQVQVRFHTGKSWVPLTSHGFALTQIPSPEELQTAIENGDGSTDANLPGESEFYDAAIRISRMLRIAKIEEIDRPKVLGALILAMYQGQFPTDPASVIGHINANVSAAVMRCQDVPADRRSALVETLRLPADSAPLATAVQPLVQQLERLNIRSIMRSSVDFLGQFYEAFLRYGCSSNQLGIVFTPRHITRFCADLLDVKLGMSVYDPACGTGGFLVAAFDRMMATAKSERAKQDVKKSLFGYDTNSTVWALCILNMIFRGDGKSSIGLGSCFEQPSVRPVDRALLNPPFAQHEEPESAFVDHALERLRAGGEAAIVLPTSVLVDDEHRQWRASLVASHAVLGAISLPAELFYPTGAPTTILLVRAHAPTLHDQAFFAKVMNDGFAISKGKRIANEGTQLPRVLELFNQARTREFDGVEPGLALTVPRESLLTGQELCAEHWLPQVVLDKPKFLEQRSYLLRQMCLAAVIYPGITDSLIADYDRLLLETNPSAGKPSRASATVDDLFSVGMGKSSGETNYPRGTIPYVSSGDTHNSIVALVDPPAEEIFDSPVLAMTGFGQVHLQPWRFVARGNGGSAVRILTPRFAMSTAELIWHAAQINANRWRFHYGRMAILPRIRSINLHPMPKWANINIDLPTVASQFSQGIERLLPD